MLIANNLLSPDVIEPGTEISISETKTYVKRYLERIKLKTEGANLGIERICVLLAAESLNKLLVDPKGGIAAFFSIDNFGKFTIALMAIDENGELIPSGGATDIPPIERWEGKSSLTTPVMNLTTSSIDGLIK